jgi:hypothetical protein
LTIVDPGLKNVRCKLALDDTFHLLKIAVSLKKSLPLMEEMDDSIPAWPVDRAGEIDHENMESRSSFSWISADPHSLERLRKADTKSNTVSVPNALFCGHRSSSAHSPTEGGVC